MVLLQNQSLMNKALKVFFFKSFLNAIALSIFLIGNLFANNHLIIVGGTGMILFSLLLYWKFLNPLIAIVLGMFLTFIISPWYIGLFWSIGIYIIFQILTLLHALFTKPDALKTRFN